MNRGRTYLSLLPMFLLVSLAAPSSNADTFEWTSAVSGNYSVAGNWTNTTGVDPAPPNIGDTALFNEAGNYAVTLTADAALDVLDVDAGTIALNSSGGTRTYDLSTGDADALFVGSGVTLNQTNLLVGDDFAISNGTMKVLAGGDITVADVTSIATATGDAELSFDGSTFDFGGLVRMGLSGFDGTLKLQNGSVGNIGGDLDFARSGTLGSGGFLNVESGSTLTTNGRILLGDIISNGAPNYNTFITVDDGTFTMNGANNLRVGDSMFDNVNAELRVRNNGVFNTGIGGGNTIVQRTGLLALETGGVFNARHDLLVTQGGEISVTSDAQLNTESLFSIDATSSVTLDGGAINANAGLDNSAGGTLDHRDGTLTVNGGAFLPNAGGNYTIDGPTVAELPHLVLGAGATISASAFRVGENNRAELTIQNGASVSNSFAYIGADVNGIGSATVDGVGSTWTSSSLLFVGDSGFGTLDVVGGGTVTNEVNGVIAAGSNSTGMATVEGSDGNGNVSTWISNGELTVGQFGDGTLNIFSGGLVSNTYGYVGRNSSSIGTVTVDGNDGNGNASTWTNSDHLYIGSGGEGTLNITGGGFVSNANGIIGDSGNGTNTVAVDGTDSDGNPSTWSNSGDLIVGNSADGTLNITGGGLVTIAGGNIGLFDPGMVTVDGTDSDGNPSTWTSSERLSVGIFASGTLSIQNGGQVFSPSGDIGESFTLFHSKVTVDGTDSSDNPSAWTIAGQLRIGYSNGNGELEITGGGHVSSSVHASIAVDEGTLGIVVVDGTDGSGNSSTWTNSGSLSVGSAGTGTLMIQNGGSVSNYQGTIGSQSDSIGMATVTGANSTWTNLGPLSIGINGDGSLTVQNGGTVSSFVSAIGLSDESHGTVIIDGSDSNDNPSTWTITNTLTVGSLGDSTLTIQDGGMVSSNNGLIAENPNITGNVTVRNTDGAGNLATWMVASTLFVGGAGSGSGGAGTLVVQNGGLVQIGDTLRNYNPGTVTLDGGCIVTNTFDNTDGGTFNYVAGSLTVDTGFTIGNDPDGVFPGNFSIDIDRHLITAATTTVSASRTLALNGGSLTTNSLDFDGTFSFNSGTLELTGGTITGLTPLNVPINGTLLANGAANLPVSASSGSQIVATGSLTLGDASQNAGFYSNGNVHVAEHTLTLDDANDAVFDSGANVSLGDGGNPGTIAAANGLTLDFGGNISGFGTISTPNDPAKPLINNGHIAGNSLSDPTEPITLTGYVKGVGTLDNVVITGTDAPGFSPATVVRGSVVYNGTVQIELGGTSDGDFDKLQHILGVGVAQLGGILDVAFLNGFLPSLDDAFEIITAVGGVNGTFTTLADELPALASGLEWEINYGANNVVLEVIAAGIPGDYNNDGLVNAADYVRWRDTMSDDIAGYDTWHANFGAANGSGANLASVPEPGSIVVALLAGMCLLGCRGLGDSRR